MTAWKSFLGHETVFRVATTVSIRFPRVSNPFETSGRSDCRTRARAGAACAAARSVKKRSRLDGKDTALVFS
jgi:hypothetical protein